MSTARTGTLDRLGQFGDGIHAIFDDTGALAYSIGLGRIHPNSPYKPGDWVQLHAFAYRGYGHHPNDPDRTGFRGFVLGGMGGTLLRGLTDDGREWCESFGALVPDGQRWIGGARCTCCPRPDLIRERDRPRNLLDLLSGLERNAR